MFGLTTLLFSGEMRIPRPFDVKAEILEKGQLSGPVTLRLTALPDHDCKSIVLRLKEIVNVDYTGKREFEKSYTPGVPVVFDVPFNLTANDTCGFIMTFTSDLITMTFRRHWSTTGDTLKTFNVHPGRTPYMINSNKGRKIDSTFVKRDEWAKAHPNGITTYIDPQGNRLTEEEYRQLKKQKQREQDSISQYNSRIIRYDTSVVHVRTDSGWIPIKKSEIHE